MVINIFKIFSTPDNMVNVCIKLKDAISDFINEKANIQEINLINCTDALYLFNQNDCKDSIDYKKDLEIEVEFENPTSNQNKKFILNGSVTPKLTPAFIINYGK